VLGVRSLPHPQSAWTDRPAHGTERHFGTGRRDFLRQLDDHAHDESGSEQSEEQRPVRHEGLAALFSWGMRTSTGGLGPASASTQVSHAEADEQEEEEEPHSVPSVEPAGAWLLPGRAGRSRSVTVDRRVDRTMMAAASAVSYRHFFDVYARLCSWSAKTTRRGRRRLTRWCYGVFGAPGRNRASRRRPGGRCLESFSESRLCSLPSCSTPSSHADLQLLLGRAARCRAVLGDQLCGRS